MQQNRCVKIMLICLRVFLQWSAAKYIHLKARYCPVRVLLNSPDPKKAKAIEDQQHLNLYPASVQTSSSVFLPEYEDATLYAIPLAVPNPDWTQHPYGPPSSQVAQMTSQRQYDIIFPH